MTAYPDTREALYELIDGGEFAGRVVKAYYQLPTTYTTPVDGQAVALVYTSGGTEGAVDRVDRATVDVYAPREDAVEVAEAIRSRLVNDGDPHDLIAGYIDEIRCDVTPHEVPFPSEAVNQASASYLVESRPL